MTSCNSPWDPGEDLPDILRYQGGGQAVHWARVQVGVPGEMVIVFLTAIAEVSFKTVSNTRRREGPSAKNQPEPVTGP